MASGPCQWPIISCCDDCGTAFDPDTDTDAASAVAVATEVLWALSGRQFSECTTKVRPCRQDACDPCGEDLGFPWFPMRNGQGNWINVRCGKCTSGCSCTEVCEIELPFGPITEVVSVTLDGLVLDPSEYRVDNYRRLVRVAETVIVPRVTDPIISFLSAGIETVNDVLCDVTPTPDSVPVNWTASGDCYVYGGGPAPMGWDAEHTLEFELRDDSGAAVPVGDVGTWSFILDDAGGSFIWPAGAVEVGGSIDSNTRSDGAFVRLTLVAAPSAGVVDVGTPRAFELPDGGRVRLEFLESEIRSGGCWPSCQDMNLPTTEVGTFEIEVKWGHPVPEAGKLAAGKLACEIFKSCKGKACGLPERVTSVTRQGVSMTFLDPMAFLDEGKTGLYLVDAFLASVNPGRLRRRPTVFSPDVQHLRKTTAP